MIWPMMLWLACQSFDMGTTAYALHSGRFREANGLLRGHVLVMKVGINVGMFALHHQVQQEHPRVIPLVMAGTGCAAGGWNLRQLTH